jgi:TRAP-type C4-dicarboxylate transport system substrate-binding protein
MEKTMRKFSLICSLAAILGLFLAAPASAKVVLKMAGQHSKEFLTTKLMAEFAKNVEERTKGEVQVRLSPANKLGDYNQVYEKLMRGTIDLATITIPSQPDARLDAAYLNYLAVDYEEARRIFAPGSSLFKLVESINESLGVKFLAFNVEGFGGFGTTKLPDNVYDPKAPKNFLMRMPPMAVFQIPCEDEGFQTVSIPSDKLHAALQTGAADGVSGWPADANYVKLRDVIKYFIANDNFLENTAYLISLKTWDKLTPEQQEIVRDEALKASAASFELAQRHDSYFLDEMEKAGIQVIRFNKEQLKAWADWCRKTSWKKLEAHLTKEVIDSLLADY